MERVKREEFSAEYTETSYSVSFRGVMVVGSRCESNPGGRDLDWYRGMTEVVINDLMKVCNGKDWDYYKRTRPYGRIAAIIGEKDYLF